MKKAPALLLSLAALALAASAQAKVVNIGYSGPLSGGAASYGKDVQSGILMAIDEINAAGGITVKGEFTLNEFATLTPDNLDFLRLYIKVRGNLKEVERILGLSYPTVRARFDTLLRSIGYEPEAADPRDETLRLLERGEITPEEATRRLRGK